MNRKNVIRVSALVMGLALLLWAQTIQYVYQFRYLATTTGASSGVRVIGSGAQYHQLSWNVSGTVSSCSVRVDSSADGVSWNAGDVIGAQACTSNGTVTSSPIVVNFIRINFTTFTGTGSVTANIYGYASNPSGGGGSPGGINGDIQFNNAGAFGGETLVPLAHGGTNANLSGTGGASQVLRQSTVGGNVSVSQLEWNALGNATGALSLSNGNNNSTFDHTSAVTWQLSNSTAALVGTPQAAPILKLQGQYWTGAATAADSWSLTNSLVAGTNGNSTLALTHAGSTGRATVDIPGGFLTFSGTAPSSPGNVAGGFAATAAVTNGSVSLYTSNASSAVLSLFNGGTSVHNFTTTGGGTTYTQTTVVNGAQCIRGTQTELLTLNTGGTTTDTAGNLLPANSIIDAVTVRVTTTITTAANWSVGDPTTATRFSSANSTLTAGTTSVGLNHMQGSVTTDAAGPVQTAAAKVRITTNANPGAGAVRITVFYTQFVPPTS